MVTRLARSRRQHRDTRPGFGYSRDLDVDVQPVPAHVEGIHLTGRKVTGR